MSDIEEMWAELTETAQSAWENLTTRDFVNLTEAPSHRREEDISYEGLHTSYWGNVQCFDRQKIKWGGEGALPQYSVNAGSGRRNQH